MNRFILIERFVIGVVLLLIAWGGFWFLTRPEPQYDPELYGLWIPVHPETQAALERERRIAKGTEDPAALFRPFEPKYAVDLQKGVGRFYVYWKEPGLSNRRGGRLMWYCTEPGVMYISSIGDHGEVQYRKVRYRIDGDRLQFLDAPVGISVLDSEYVRASAAEVAILSSGTKPKVGP
ncbi:MAG: hypothetical protein KF784_09000 [Fimbriimonadaceae bacterium]|nr:hypothetical protein [Fimbriimonadaceae bacterium]